MKENTQVQNKMLRKRKKKDEIMEKKKKLEKRTIIRSHEQVFQRKSSMENEEKQTYSGMKEAKQYDEEIAKVDDVKRKNANITGFPLKKRMPGYERAQKGGLLCSSSEETKNQKGIVLEIIKANGKQLFQGVTPVFFSLPVKLFEPRSFLERMTE